MRTLILLIFFCNSALAITESQKVTSVYDPNYDIDSNVANFSQSVDIASDFAVVGNPFRNTQNPYMHPNVYVYKKNDSDVWDIFQKLIPSDQSSKPSTFGSAVAISNNNNKSIAVFDSCGSDLQVPYNNCRSAIYIFEMNADGFWEEAQKISPSENDPNWYGLCFSCGISLAIHGNTFVIGNKLEENKNEIVGGLLIFERALSGVWNKTQTIYGPAGQSDTFFPWDIDIHNNKIIASNTLDSENLSRSGAVYFYEKDGSFWYESQTIKPNDSYQYQYFGESISLSDTNIFVGDKGYGKSHTPSLSNLPPVPGSAYVFSLNKEDLSWYQSQKIFAPATYAHNAFGASVSVSNNAAVITAAYPRLQNDPLNFGYGYAHLYLKDETGIWREREILTASNDTNPGFGETAAILGSDIIIGHDRKIENNIHWWGAAYFYNSNQLLTNVPAMGGIGLLALGLSMLGLGAVRSRRRH